MDRMSDPATTAELGTTQSAAEAAEPRSGPTWWRSLQAASTRRALLLTALGGLLIAGLITAIPGTGPGLSPIGLNSGSALLGSGARGNATFDHAQSGTCLNWPEQVPDAAQIVDCKDEHRFEVAEAIDMRTFPGTEYGPDAAPPSEARIKQISQEQCQAAARQYLGAKYDPNGRFSVSLVWSGDKAWRQGGERRMLCGLQLAGPDNRQLAFAGKVADIDQSKVWPAGTCLGIDPATNQPTDIPVDCAKPHAMEVTGSVNLAEKFPGPVPPDGDQDQFVKDACTKMTDDYLAPVALRKTTLTLIYSTISLPSWTAGSKQVSCSIGATLGNGGWSTLLNSAKGQLLINGQPPVAVPDIPEERLDMPPIPLPPVDTSSQVNTQIDLSDQSSGQSTQGNNHLPGQQQAGPTQTQTSSAPTSSGAVPPPQGNTFLNGPPPAPGPVGDGQQAPQDGPAVGDPAASPPPGDVVVPPAAPVLPGPAPGQ
ncbi:septum formation family protein [Mycolicibacterium sp. 050158]|uniref:septum formation family protein n=1 Tax=Mycolicibacterium sp. 050158 TaxID=3090602 RepID=UPI00299E432F|nr:septum formation family protein [Mycolicibacterium sp. 050158]MDX1889556.1 septum formation family protein [Mycolicibacterium sp. 050158]